MNNKYGVDALLSGELDINEEIYFLEKLLERGAPFPFPLTRDTASLLLGAARLKKAEAANP